MSISNSLSPDVRMIAEARRCRMPRNGGLHVPLLLLTFVVGGAWGWSAKTVCYENPRRWSLSAPEPSATFIASRLQEQLSLDREQTIAVTEIVRRYQKHVCSLKAGLKAALDAFHKEVTVVLRPDQQPRMEAFVHEIRD